MPVSALIAALLLPVQDAPAPAGGTIAIERPAVNARRPTPDTAFADGVETALIDAGFIAIPDTAHARSVARFSIVRTAQGAVRSEGALAGPASVAGGLGAAAMGGAVALGLGSGGARVGQLVSTELTIRITRRGESGEWIGRAVTHRIAGTRGDDPSALAKALTQAIMRNFGGPSGVLVSVP